MLFDALKIGELPEFSNGCQLGKIVWVLIFLFVNMIKGYILEGGY